MKRFTTFLVFALALLLSIPTQARLWSLAELTPPEFVSTSGLLPGKQLTKAQQFKQKTLATNVKAPRSLTANSQVKKAHRAASDYVIITDQPAGELKTFHRSGNYLYVSNNQLNVGAQSGNVDIVFGADGAIYIKDPLMGTTYGSWVSGTYDTTAGKVTIPTPQNLYYNGNYDACIAIVPIISYNSTDFNAQDITYTVTKDGDNLVLKLDGYTSYAKTLGAGWTDDHTIQVYGEYNTVLTEGAEAAPELVVAPEGAEFKEYTLSGTGYSKEPYSGTASIAVVGNDVYLKGYSSYLPEALIKGVKDGNTVTFPAQQWLGKFSGYDSYFMPTQAGATDAVFTYDPAADTYTATGDVFSLLGGQYIDVYVTNPVLKGVVEKAAVPANPSISSVENSSYGMVVVFNVPNVDVNGDGLVASKLGYQFFVDVEKEISALTFTPATHSYLTENLSIIPFGFTENYDFYQGEIYLNDLYSTSWNKIGIKSIYTGGGVTNETEIQWYTIKGYAAELLAAEIATAEALVADAQYKAGQNVLNAAINAAKEVSNNAEATAAEKEAALNTLKAAENEFKAANTAYGKLVAEIATAEALKSDALTNGVAAFNNAIAAAQAVIDKAADATSAQINEAIAALQQAEADFKAANGFVTVAWDATKQGYTNQQVIESAVINDDLTLTLAKNEGSDAPAYYNSGTSIRVYDKNTVTVTGGEKVTKITKIVITQSGSNYGTQLKANVGELTRSGSTLTWIGDAKEVVFTNDKGEASNSVQTRLRTLTIDYQIAVEPEPEPEPDVTEGVYYIYNPYTKKFLSRGADWGTHAVVDDYGFPTNVTLADGKYTLTNVDGIGAYGDDFWMYADAGGDRVRTYSIEKTEGGYFLHNTARDVEDNRVYVYLKDDGKYKVAGNAVVGDNIETLEQAVWQFLTPAKREAILTSNIAAQKTAAFAAAGIAEDAELVEGETVSVDVATAGSWTQNVVRTQGGQPAVNENGMEMWQATGSFNKTIENVPSGLYKVTVNAFYRDGNNDAVAGFADQGYNLSVANLDANGNKAQIKSWGIDRVDNGNPNSMAQAAALFAEGKYQSETYAYVGEDGLLNLTLNNPSYIGNGWFIVGKVAYTPVKVAAEPEPELKTIVSWEKGETADPEGTWTAVGAEGKLPVIGYTSKYNKNTTSVSTITFPNSIVSGGEWQCALKLTGDFKVGDVITIQPFTQMSASDLADGSKWATILLYNSEKKQIANLTGATDAASKAVTDGHEEEGDPKEFTYTLESDYTELYFGRGGNTRINLMKVNVKRAGGSEPEPQPELKDYTYGFPQSLNGWTTIDADDDGYAWELQIAKTNPGLDGVPGLVSSASYAAQTALTPDNYLVSPKLKLDGKITFYAFAQDASYPAEHFGVAVSTASGTQAADFTMVTEEWEMAASRRALPENAPRRAQGKAYLYEVDLSQFAGQEGYVAIRHYNCTDQFRLNVDNITLTTSELIDAYDPDLEVAPEQPAIVVLPEGAKVEDYSLTYTDKDGASAAKPVKVAVVDNEVYIQGFSQYIAEAWVKGKLENGVVTFAANQLMGEYGSYGESYFFYASGSLASVNTFAYDAEADTYTATGEVFGVLGEQYYDGRYFNPVLSKVKEVAGTPATPSISEIASTQYGDVMVFNVPVFDTNGNAMVTSKLSFQFFIDDENTPMVFTPEYFVELTENLTVIPYGFTENYDFYTDQIYLNMPHDTWKKIGIQSIYTGGGETNKSEISWFKMPEPPVTPPAGLTTEAYSFKANAKEYSLNDDSEFEPYTSLVQVGFAGDDVYIQGLATDAPELWVKATKNSAGKYVIPANQFMGNLEFWGYTFPYYWTAVDEQGNCVDAVLDFNAETSTFTTAQTLALNESESELDYFILYNNVEISKFVEVAATPADPTFEAFNISDEVGYSTIYASVPIVGTEGEVLNPEKLFYIVWIEKNGEAKKYTFTATLYADDFEADVVEVPYNHDGYDIYKGGEIIYLEDELEELNSWTKVGIQSVYYGKNERHESNIVWSDDTKTPTGISTVAAEKVAPAAIYNLNGQKVEKTRKGLYIVNGQKVVVK